jgi:O-antigen/teichoic acid export membrane protein
MTIFIASERIINRSHFILLFSVFNGIISSVLPYIGARNYGYFGFAIAYLESQVILGILLIPALFTLIRRHTENLEMV